MSIFVFPFFLDKGVELVSGGSVINGITPYGLETHPFPPGDLQDNHAKNVTFTASSHKINNVTQE